MIDSRCTVMGLIDMKHTKTQQLRICRLEHDIIAREFNGKFSQIMHYVIMKLHFSRHLKHVQLLVHLTKNQYNIILEFPWLKQHNS